jgi:hypothetical protein
VFAGAILVISALSIPFWSNGVDAVGPGRARRAAREGAAARDAERAKRR